MNSLYQFPIKRFAEVEKTEETPEGKLTKKVKEEIAVTVVLKKPSRTENREAETLYSVELARCMRAGMLTEPLLVKYYAKEGGIFTEAEQKEYSSLMLKFVQTQNEYQRAQLISDDAEKKKQTELYTSQLIEIQNRLQDFKRAQQSLFAQTAEKKAGDLAIAWYATHLTHLIEGEEEPKPLFTGATFEEKLAQLDAAEERRDEFVLKAWYKALLFTTFWYMGNAETKDDFKMLEESLDAPATPPAEEEKKAE